MLKFFFLSLLFYRLKKLMALNLLSLGTVPFLFPKRGRKERKEGGKGEEEEEEEEEWDPMLWSPLSPLSVIPNQERKRR